jgi:serine/threonine-protein kinase
MSATVGAAPDHAAVGALIDGKYEVEKVIGEGAVGLVVAARNIELGERVALKFLREELLELADRFTSAAKAASAIKSEHAATVFDVGRTPEGVPFLVMEFLEGKDLVAEQSSLDVAALAELAMQTCEALAAAHAKGIVHRDLRAKNLFVVQRAGTRTIKVVDFGLSKAALAGPEKEADARDDLAALGVVLREALGGKEPTGLVEVIQKCVEKERKDRYQNAAELAIALMPFAPKRARVSAKRAGEILVLAGLAKAESVLLESEAADEAPAFPPPPSSSRPATNGRSTVSSQSAVAVPAAPPPANDKVKTVLATLAVVIGLAGTAYSITNRAHAPPPETTTKTAEPAPSDAKPPSPPEPVQTAPIPSVSAATVTPKAVKPLPVASATKVPVSRPGPWHPTPKASTSSSAAPAASTGKKPDALDIGY